MRSPGAIRLLYGSTLLLFPSAALRLTGTREPSAAAVTFLRILGARHVAQAAFLDRRRGTLPGWVGAITDALHALSMVGIAFVSSTYRKGASADAIMASVLCATEVREARAA